MSDYLSLSLELNRVEQQLKETEEKLQRALGVIEHYGALNAWIWTRGTLCYNTIHEDDCEYVNDFASEPIGGKRARQFLQTIREQNNV